MKRQNEKQVQPQGQRSLDRAGLLIGAASKVGQLRQTIARGFTRLDLLAVVAVLGLLFLLMLPALAKPGLNSKSFQCLNNHRQLCNAWLMYADDNSDRIVYASHSGILNDQGNLHAWTLSEMDFNPANLLNWDTNADIVLRPLWPYTARDAAIYKCPEDQSYVLVNGVAKPRVRSMSVNFFLGGYAGTSGGAAGGNSPYRLFLKTTELTTPGPAKTFVFVDQRADSINWGNFHTYMDGYSPSNSSQYRYGDLPGFLHDGAAAISFADGCTELHRWTDRRTTPPLSQNGAKLPSDVPSPNNPDIAWLQDHATRPK